MHDLTAGALWSVLTLWGGDILQPHRRRSNNACVCCDGIHSQTDRQQLSLRLWDKTCSNYTHVHQTARRLIPVGGNSHCCETADLLEEVSIFRTHLIQKYDVLGVLSHVFPSFVSHFTWMHSLEWKFEAPVLYATSYISLSVECNHTLYASNLKRESQTEIKVSVWDFYDGETTVLLRAY